MTPLMNSQRTASSVSCKLSPTSTICWCCRSMFSLVFHSFHYHIQYPWAVLPRRMVLESRVDSVTWPYRFRFLTIMSRSLWLPVVANIGQKPLKWATLPHIEQTLALCSTNNEQNRPLSRTPRSTLTFCSWTRAAAQAENDLRYS